MSTQGLDIRRSSASVLGSASGLRTLTTVSKYIDTSTCIGCKACEVACQEWNDLKPVATHQVGTYQTLPTLHSEYWNLIRFNERDFDGGIVWLMRKDQCMHCDEPGCLAACPAPGAIVQYANGIVDVNPDQCIGCRYCETGCPFDVPRFSPDHRKDVQVHALRRPRLRRPRARVHQGLPDRLPALRHQGRHARARDIRESTS